MTLTPEFIEKLKTVAASKCWADVENLAVDDYAGGNIDDAYDGGERAGYVQLAREVLENIGIDWENK
jgi:hypothetical protein